MRSVTTVTFDIWRLRDCLQPAGKHVILQAHPDVARRLRGENKELLDAIANRFGRALIESVSDFVHHVKITRETRSY